MGCGSSREADPWALASEGSVAGLAQWLDGDGSVNALDTVKGRGSLLHAAARHDQVECIKLLLRCGANVDLATPEHGTALHAAAAAGSGNAVTQLLASGATPTLTHNGATAAELAHQRGFPATAGLIRMASERGTDGDNPDSSRSSSLGAVQQQQLRAAAAAAQRAAQQQAQAAKLREIHKQISAVDNESSQRQQSGQLSCFEARRTSCDLLGNGASPSPSTQQSYQGGSLGSSSAQARRVSPEASVKQQQPAQPAWQQAPTEAELQALVQRAQHGKAAGSTNGGTTTERSAQGGLEPSSPGPPLSPAQPLAGQPAVDAVAAAVAGTTSAAPPPLLPTAVNGGSGALASRPVAQLPRIDSDESLHEVEGADAGESGSGSQESSAGNSLVNDPLLEFVRKAMLSKQPSLRSPFAGAAAAGPPASPSAQQQQRQADGQQAGQQGQQQDVQQQQQQQQGQQRGDAAEPATPTGGQSGTPTAAGQPGRTPSSELNHRSSSRNLQPSTQASRSSGSMSLSVDIRPWEIQFEDLALQKTIGEGSFGKVYVAKWHETLVAVKVLLDLEETQKAAGPDAAWTLSNPILFNLQKECGLMASLRHPNVVQFMGVSAIPPAMVTEYCAKGSLADVLKAASVSKQKAAQLTWLRRLNMALDATKGMLYLHKRGIVHRDLKSPNLLVESTWKVKVADFNLSKIVEDTGSGRSTVANMNPRWLAPEILNGEPATTASDVFSWGVVMWELLTFQLPWPHVSPWGLVGKLMDGMRLAVPPRDKLPGHDTAAFTGLDDYVALMQRCWAQEPAERPDFEEVIHELRKLLESQARAVGS